MKELSAYFIGFSQKLPGGNYEVSGEKRGCADQSSQIEKARQEWLAAISLFNNVCTEDLIDYAIYNLNAAERRYAFLLREARKGNIQGKILLEREMGGG